MAKSTPSSIMQRSCTLLSIQTQTISLQQPLVEASTSGTKKQVELKVWSSASKTFSEVDSETIDKHQRTQPRISILTLLTSLQTENSYLEVAIPKIYVCMISRTRLCSGGMQLPKIEVSMASCSSWIPRTSKETLQIMSSISILIWRKMLGKLGKQPIQLCQVPSKKTMPMWSKEVRS